MAEHNPHIVFVRVPPGLRAAAEENPRSPVPVLERAALVRSAGAAQTHWLSSSEWVFIIKALIASRYIATGKEATVEENDSRRRRLPHRISGTSRAERGVEARPELPRGDLGASFAACEDHHCSVASRHVL
jgi:hypothetical protein